MSGICGNHRQWRTGRFLSYWATYSASATSVLYMGMVNESGNLLALPEGTVYFDPKEMSADEAVRLELGRFIDDTEFGEGTPPQPSWTDYGPYK